MINKILAGSLATLLLVVSYNADAFAQKKSEKSKKKTATESVELQIPNGVALNVIVRRILLSLNDANLTGNYTVFRELGSPGFRSANTSARLAGIFAQQRAQRIDFSPLVLFNPVLTKKPEITKEKLLRLTGFMPTKPLQLNFDLMFEPVGGQWMLFGVSVNTSRAQVAQSESGKGKPGKAKKKRQ